MSAAIRSVGSWGWTRHGPAMIAEDLHDQVLPWHAACEESTTRHHESSSVVDMGASEIEQSMKATR